MKLDNGRTPILLIFLLGGMVISWIIFSSLFTIFSYIESIYFAFDKIPGHFFSLPIFITVGLFIFLFVSYSVLITHLLTKNISRVVCALLISTLFFSLVAALVTYPVGALDVFNYVLMGKLAIYYQQNPFVYPFDLFASHDSLHRYAIFLNVTTGYGPWWLLLTSFTVLLSGTSFMLPMVLSYKLMTCFFFIITGVVLYSIPKEKNDKVLSATIYLLNPFIIFEGMVNAHNDILVAFFLVLSWWAYKKKHSGIFLFIVLAGLIKLYAFVLVPLFLIMVINDKWNKKDIIVSILLAAVGFIAIYLPFWEKGKLLASVFKGLNDAQVINGFSPYSLMREFFVTLSVSTNVLLLNQLIFIAIFTSIFLCSIFYLLKTKDYLRSCIFILLSFILTVTIFQPWYVLPTLALLSLSKKKIDIIFSVFISSFALLSYPISVWGWFHSGWSTFVIHIFLACFIAVPSLIYVAVFLRDAMRFRSRVQG